MKEKQVPRFNSNSERFRDAFALAAELHADQTRKSTDIPYIAHLMGVSSIAIEYGGDEDQAIAALLHDAAEDCGGLPILELIRDRFGDVVADIVESCTDTFEEPKPEWIERKVRYLAHVASASPAARLVSAADKLFNVRSILKDFRTEGEAVFDRFKKSKFHVLWYYRRLADAYTRADPKSELPKELDRVVTELEEMAVGVNDRVAMERVYDELDREVARAAAAKAG
jgi:(p)ppGpp synthase/HD superfamily hydrolase